MLVIIHPDQVRLYPHYNQPHFVYTLPNKANGMISSMGAILSGYDFAPQNAMAWNIQLSINSGQNSFEALITTYNNTRFYSINYIMVIVSQEVSK